MSSTTDATGPLWSAGETEAALAIARDRGVPAVRRLEALRSVEVNDPPAGERACRELLLEDDPGGGSSSPFFKLGLIQALRYRNPRVLFGPDADRAWLQHVVAAGQRAASDGRRTQPHFMLLGASKCGTSSLVRYLAAMPCVALASRLGGIVGLQQCDERDCGVFDPLETHVFDFPPHQAPRELVQAQCALYAPPMRDGSDDAMLLGHYTPHYIFHPFAPQLTASSVGPGVRFLVLLREPVSRAVSSYQFKVETKRESRPFAQAMRDGMQQHRALVARICDVYAGGEGGDLHRRTDGAVCVEDTDADSAAAYQDLYFSEVGAGQPRLHEPVLFNEHIGKSVYHEQLRRWFAHFPREAFLISSLEDFAADNVGGVSRMLAHIGVPASEVATLGPEIEAITRARWNVTGRGQGAGGGGGGKAKETPDAKVLEEMREFFKPHNERLYQLLGRRLWDS